MKKITIPFSGITRNTDDTISSDGECMELINARVKNGSISPVGKPILQKSFNVKYSKGFYHSLAKKYVFIKEEDGSVVYGDENYSNITSLPGGFSNVYNIEFVGFILCAMTSDGIQYFNFKNGTYNHIGDKPDFNINFWACEEKNLTYKADFVYEFTQGRAPTMDYRDVPSFLEFLDSNKNKLLETYKNEARFADPICIRAALRMYNGNYISHSPIYVIFPQENTHSGGYLDNITKEWVIGGISVSQTLNTYKVRYDFSFSDIAQWNDIITSVDIFISKPFSIINAEIAQTEGIYVSPETPLIKVYDWNGFEEKIMQAASLLYLSVSDYGNSGSGYIKNISESNDRLIDDAFSRNSICANSSYVYNSRLHLGNIKNILFKGFAAELSLSPDYKKYNGLDLGTTYAQAKIYTYINTEEGEKIVLNESMIMNPLCPMFCYPDYRASKAIIYAALPKGEGIIYRKKNISLSSKDLNLAYYIGWDSNYNRVAPIDLRESTEISEAEYNNPGIEINNTENSHNKIKVSDLNSPFSFPADQTYTASNGVIIGMASATSALSTGQFGQFPLYVFSSDGIYALSIGTGNIAYSSSHPVSRDVCINTESITQIDNAIVFNTDAGLKLLTGSSIQKLSDKIEGYLSSSFISSEVLDRIIQIPKLQESISEFKYYIEKASIGYIYEDNELIISNKEYSYSYVYNLKSGEWHKISESITRFLNSYPQSLAISSNESGCAIYNMYNPHRTINDIAIITRPVKLGSITHKRILQSALRGIIKPSLSDLYIKGEPVQFRGEDISIFSNAGFYILGSNDAEHFKLIAGTEKLNDIRDLITKMNKTKAYKYFIFCLVGGVRTDVAINYIEVMADETFDNRLR